MSVAFWIVMGAVAGAGCMRSSATTAPMSTSAPVQSAACADVRAIDWANATVSRGALPVVSSDHQDRMTGPLRLEGGVYKWYLDPDGVELGERYELVRDGGAGQGPVFARFGDLDGDGCEEVVLQVTDTGWGTNRSREALWIVGVAGTAATIVATVPGGDGYCLQFAAAPEVRGGALVTRRTTPAGDDESSARPETCGCGNLGGGVRTQRWVWRDDRMIEDRDARAFVAGPACG